MKKLIPVLFICIAVTVFFWHFFLKGLLPIPADTIIGLYHPFRDLYAKEYPRGTTFKNFLITDPVRQQYPWRGLVISAEKKLELPLWNPYSFAGMPLLANFQSASFYPFNILFYLMPFAAAWSLMIFLGTLLGGIFLFLYLDNLKLSKWASFLGAFTFSFSGFFIAWMEWGTITHVGLWLPLILLSIDKLFLNKKNLKWLFIYLFSLVFSFFAGHLQIFFYLFIFSWAYFLARWLQLGLKKKIFFLFIILNSLFIILTAVQWIPTLQLISLSARNVDVVNYNNSGWFIPFQHLIQFVAPDFFGNPTTLNYWGAWNYGELVGYVGIIPLMLAIFAMFYRRDKKTLFFGTILFLSLIFAFPTFFAKIPYLLEIPFLSTSQPTRLLFIVDFTLAVLAAFGFDYLLRIKRKIIIIYPLIFISITFAGLWIFIPKEHLSVVRSNLLLPTILLISSSIVFFVLIIVRRKDRFVTTICVIIVAITAFDLLRFGWKFTPFTQSSYLFPPTRAITFLQENAGNNRIMTADSRILPPNFSAIYKLQSIDGYDPLYLLRYGELIAASERRKADINPPFGFNRIVTPRNYESRIIDLLGVKYALSLSILNSSKLIKVFQEGQTIIYENKNVLPRAFFVKDIKFAKGKEEAMRMLFDPSISLIQTGIVENGNEELGVNWSVGSLKMVQYSANKIVINTKNTGNGFLVLIDSFYPTWKAAVDGVKTEIYKTDYNFRGVVVSSGEHKVEFYNSLF
ncbi:MAG: YfhO family protein [Candidatus Parcubacteria bacterium]|nr:YfhO family protein [Candidatus Parcubacteria bacterium]